MSYLLDTCVLSEFTHRQPHPRVVEWLAEADEDTLFLSVLAIGEIQHGIEKLEDSPRKEDLRQWLTNDLLPRFEGRIVLLDVPVLLRWGELVGRLERQGRKLPAIDGLLAATALTHDLILVTRNTADFEHTGVKLLNPWEEK
ncbi:type II toxin-antitoxin system VapC family toxin [Anaerolinea sp.]|uniref:type II toxin-antitoxin system VapC family toxin n=1 Tax=Anaerolinea sp. TaxID=1872519 RepID=UPI002ACDD1EE|nr:type II toxin-antitoxin system VapC family toxin [Anaerolinea sp.]